MSGSVLSSVTLGYEPLWDRSRRCVGMRLRIDCDNHSAVDAQHLTHALAELWPRSAPALLLQIRSAPLLCDVLDDACAQDIAIEIQDPQLAEHTISNRVRTAAQRGHKLVWSGEPGTTPQADMAACFGRTLRSLTPQESLSALRVSLRQQQDAGLGSAAASSSPVQPPHWYQNLASQALVEHALDRQGVPAVVGWPMEEVLHGYRLRQIQAARSAMSATLRAIDADVSNDAIEDCMGQDPLLCYRFLRFANSAALGARTEIGSLRQGLLVMGISKLRNWLLEQMPQANCDLNLEPVRRSMVWRARIMEQLSDAGAEDELRREVFLCGIFSQLDLLLGEPLGAAIHRLPIQGRISSAIVGQSGPYAPWLEVATALECGNTRLIREVCRGHKLRLEEVNRALLRALATAT